MLGWVHSAFLRAGVRKAQIPELVKSRDRDLELANEALRIEVGKREAAEEETRKGNYELEERVHARTAELVEINAQLIRLAAVVRDSSESIWTVGLDGRIISWNLAAEQLYGHSAAEVLGQPVAMLAPAALAGEMDEILERLQRGRSVGSFETTRVRKNGESFRGLLTPSPIKSEAGEVLGASVLIRDITDRTRAQELFRLAVEAAPNVMIMADAQGNIVLVNAQTEKLFGYNRDELIGHPVEMLLPAGLRDKHESDRLAFMKAPQVRSMGAGRDLCGVRKDGTAVSIEVALNPIETEQGVFVLSAIVDITQRKKAEAEIKRLTHGLERRVAERTAELTAANADLESFSYSVAHDLRAPLRQIAGFSKILAEECGQEISVSAHHHLQKIQDGAQLMGCLVDDLLNLAKLHRQALDRRPVALNDLMDKVVEELKLECGSRDVEWRVHPLWTTECDAALMRLVFVNLLSNALKFTRLRDHAVIEVGQTSVDGKRVIFVRDNGAGFDMAYAGNLFGVFQRLHSSKQFEGTGVGLANVQRIVQKHGGRIWAEAEVDRGATFFFTIPEAIPQEPNPA